MSWTRAIHYPIYVDMILTLKIAGYKFLCLFLPPLVGLLVQPLRLFITIIANFVLFKIFLSFKVCKQFTISLEKEADRSNSMNE